MPPSTPPPTTNSSSGGGGNNPSSPTPSPRQLHTQRPRLRTSSSDSGYGSPGGGGGPRRTRFNSRDLKGNNSNNNNNNAMSEPPSYLELEDHLMPLEYGRSQKMLGSASFTIFLTTYASLLLLLQFTVSALFLATGFGSSGGDSDDHSSSNSNNIADDAAAHDGATTTAIASLCALLQSKITSWTATSAIHTLLTLVYIHWLKGSFLLDEQGELGAMTAWEQLEAVPHQNVAVRRTLLTVPTVLAYTACVTSQFDPTTCLINVVLWIVAMAGKLPFMNGVRLFGINRTVGIDDLPRKMK